MLLLDLRDFLLSHDGRRTMKDRSQPLSQELRCLLEGPDVDLHAPDQVRQWVLGPGPPS